MKYSIECVVAGSNELGEGPVWDDVSGCLYWVDGTGRRVGKPNLWRLDPRTGATCHWLVDHDVGALALRRDGSAVLALDDGFYFFNFDTGKLDLIRHIDPQQARTRLNDAKCDRRGRFFAGAMDDQYRRPTSPAYKLNLPMPGVRKRTLCVQRSYPLPGLCARDDGERQRGQYKKRTGNQKESERAHRQVRTFSINLIAGRLGFVP